MKKETKPSITSERRKRVTELRNLIRHYSRSYYLPDDPTEASPVSDTEFDELVKELKKLEAMYGLEFEKSPTKEVGAGAVSSLFSSVEHEVEMISLDNAFGDKELDNWVGRLKKLSKSQDFPEIICELKFDGLGISFLYEEGKMVRATTRGDGKVGENITENIAQLTSAPKKLKGNYPKRMEIRGEIYMPVSVFEKLNEVRKEQDLKLYTNPRNTAAGMLRQKDSASVATKELSWWSYQLIDLDNSQNFKTHSETLDFLKELGFPVCDDVKVIETKDEMVKYLKNVLETRYDRDYEIDGSVLKLNDLQKQKEMGSTSHHPRWAIAYKFPAEEKETLLKEIQVSIGAKGKATPIAILESIFVGGSTIGIATLHNEDQIKEKDLRPGDLVIVRKAGDVIPEVVSTSSKNVRKNTSKAWEFPSICPCPIKSTLVRNSGEAAHRCVEKECPSQHIGRMEHFASKEGMDIDGLGGAWVKSFVELGLIKNVSDIYSLDFNSLKDIKNADGRQYGEKMAIKLEEAVNESKKQPLRRLLFSLAIPNVGAGTSKDVSAYFTNIDRIMSASVDDITKVDGVGNTQAESIYKFMRDTDNINTIQQLKNVGVNMKIANNSKKEQKLNGLKIVVTGTLERYKRTEIVEVIESMGGIYSSGVTNATDIVIVGGSNRNETSTKAKKALELGKKVISEEDFHQMVS